MSLTFLKFQSANSFSLSVLFWGSFVLENIVIILLFLNLYLYLYFLPTFSDFYYFSLFFLHVPISWLSLLNYLGLMFICFFFLLTGSTSFFFYSYAFLYSGILFTLLTLFTGMLWGLPLWGLLFAVDARFITVVVLLVLYLVYWVLLGFAERSRLSFSFVAYLILLGSLNLPLIKYSVDWWNTLHQTSSITQLYGTVHFSVYIPLLLFFMMLSFIYCLIVLLLIQQVYIHRRAQFFKFLS